MFPLPNPPHTHFVRGEGKLTGESLFSQRTSWSLTENALTTTVKTFKAAGHDVIDLTVSNPTQCGFRYSKKFLSVFSNPQNLVYEPSPRGLLKARETICDYYRRQGFSLSPEQIFLTASTSEGYNYLFRLLANPGDNFLFPNPSYPLFSFLGDLNDVVLNCYPLAYNHSWAVALDLLKNRVDSKTKGIVLVNPNNPTGSFVKERERHFLNDLCRERKIALISDEVFWDFAWDDKTSRVSLVNNREALTFTLGGLSKTLALPQMKLSWIIVNGPQDLVKEAAGRLEVIADTYLSVNTPAQQALAAWMSLREEIQEHIKKRLQQNLLILKKYGCEILDAQGGWYAIMKLPSTRSEDEWLLEFLNKDRVLVHPGYFFDFEEGCHMILSLLTPSRAFEEGIQRVVKRIQSLR